MRKRFCLSQSEWILKHVFTNDRERDIITLRDKRREFLQGRVTIRIEFPTGGTARKPQGTIW